MRVPEMTLDQLREKCDRLSTDTVTSPKVFIEDDEGRIHEVRSIVLDTDIRTNSQTVVIRSY